MFKNNLLKVIEGQDLTEKEMINSMEMIMSDQVTEHEKSSFLTALKIKGESLNEIVGAAKVMRNKAKDLKLSDENLLDTCGTGGDGHNTFNISTAVAILCACGEVPVIKHGNRSVSSKCGSADVLEKLGYNINQSTQEIKDGINDHNIGFMYAPNFHSAMKNVMSTRKNLGIRTIFNLLGPLTNPAKASSQIIGVYDEKLTETFAQVLRSLGVQRAMVVHGLDGLDEITTTTKTKVSELKNNQIITYYIDPKAYFGKYDALSDLAGGGIEQNAEIIQNIFEGKHGPKRNILLINAAAAFYLTDQASTLKEGIKLAEDIIDSGLVNRKLKDITDKQLAVHYVS